MLKIIVLLFLIPRLSYSQTVPFRKYKQGEVLKYRLTSTAYRNDKFSGKTISVAEHRVIKDAPVFLEQIRWLSKISFTPKDTTLLDSVAQSVSPYSISLSPQSKVLLPKLTIPEMVGDITDLNTFYVAIAPALNAQKLSRHNKSFSNDELRQGNFADSIVIVYGTDCIVVTQTLLELTKKFSVIETRFSPPPSFCLTPLLDTVAGKSFDQFNNIQMIQKGADGKLNLFWGVENFTIITKIDARSGKILHATMTNNLTLRMRYNASQDLKTYAVEMPVTVKRLLELELLQ
jgi:hypothetical protein